MKRHGWVKPLVEINCQYGACDYPIVVRINFENGVTRRYRDDELHQTPPIVYEKKPEGQNIVVGYQYRGLHRKSRVHKRNCEARHW